MRVACALVPDLPLAAVLRASPELAGLPLALASGPGARAEVVTASPEALRRGVRRHMNVSHARAACAALGVRTLSPALERAAREALLDAAQGLAPRAALAPEAMGAWAGEAAAYVDATGVDALFHSEEGFATALGVATRRVGLPAVVALAGSRAVAHLLARELSRQGQGPDAVRVLRAGDEARRLAALPIDLLDPGDELAEALSRYGVRTLGELLALPRRALAARLGPGVLALVALASGDATEVPLPIPERGPPSEAIDLDHALDRLEPLVFVLQGLLSRLLARLEARALACGELALHLDLEGGGRDERRIGFAAPTSDLRTLVRLASQSLESHPPRAAVLGARIGARGVPAQRDQLDLFRPAGPAPAVLGRTLAELESLCGADRIGAPEVADDPRPGAFALRPFSPPRATRPAPPARAPVLGLRVLRPPARAQVTLDSVGRLAWIRSPVANGPVLHAAGPWRATGGWWSAEERFAYDSFDVETGDGTLSRLRYDHLGGCWEIDGLYD